MTVDFKMNEFTKEELEEIKKSLAYVISNGQSSDKAYYLIQKVDLMIEDYCDHEFDMTNWVHDSTGCRWYECKKFWRRFR